ncbi:MAG: PepSY-like domain-containing protein [Paludibacteraceae bacterium]|nr:PepSY-like domain-containing protein [Paludibacteraceae bacterium]
MKTSNFLRPFLCILFAFVSLFNVWADNNKPISFDQLPAKSQSFIKEYFSNDKVSLAVCEKEFLEVRYKVILTSSAKVEFYKNGDWKEVTCKFCSVPEELIPSEILKKIKELYTNVKITEIDKDNREYEVKLSNGVELTFNKEFILTDIDD